MLHPNLIKEFAHELGWRYEEMEIALKALFHKESIVKDWQEFLGVCLSATNPKTREHKVTSLLIKNLEGDLVNTICNLLFNFDPGFTLLALFNAIDILKIMKKTSGSFYPSGRKPFLISGVLLGEHPITMEKGREPDPRLSAYELCYEFLNSLVLEKSEGSNNELESLLFNVTEQAYFLTFNIKAFRNLADRWSYNPSMRKKAMKLGAALNSSFFKHRREITEGQYWTYFVLVEKLKDRYGLRGAFREVGRRLGEPSRTIERRYFEKKKEAKKERLSLEDIIKKYNLGQALEDLLAE